MKKISYSDLVARLDERVKNLMEQNKEDHIEILKTIEDLSNHVNHKGEERDARLKCLEDKDLERKVTNKTLAKIGAMVVATVTFCMAIIKLIMGVG